MAEITVAAALDSLDTVLRFVDGQMEQAGCPLKLMTQVDMAVEEIFVNIARYPASKSSPQLVQVHRAPQRCFAVRRRRSQSSGHMISLIGSASVTDSRWNKSIGCPRASPS